MKLGAALEYALSSTTRLTAGKTEADEALLRKSCCWHPVAGLFIGVCTALPIVWTVQFFGQLQGLVLLCSVLYLFLLEWLTRFRNFREFAGACELLTLGHSSADSRKCCMQNSYMTIPGFTSGGFLIAAKALVCYLLFTRVALFGNTALLGFILIMTPVMARTAALFLNITRLPFEHDEKNNLPLVRINWAVPVCYAVFLAVLAVIFFGITRYYGKFIDFSSWHATQIHFSYVIHSVAAKPAMRELIVMRGIQDMLFLLAGAYLVWQYWSVEASKKTGVMPDCFRGAVIETGELASLIAFLIIADNGIF